MGSDIEHDELGGLSREEAAKEASRLHNEGRGLYMLGQYSEAKARHKQALHLRNVLYGPEHPEVAFSLNEIGAVHRAAGDLLGAKLCFKSAMEIFDKSQGNDSPEFSATLSNLGHSLSEIGETERAIQCVYRALRIDISLHGPFDYRVGDGYNSLGVMCMMNGEFAKAADFFTSAMEVAKKTLGPENRITAERMNNAALALVETNNISKALSMLLSAHDITLKALGENHHDTARSRNNIGAVMNASGDPDGAIPWLEKSVSYYRDKKGIPEKFIESANNLGTALFNVERLRDSAAIFEEALVEEIHLYGESHNNVASKLSILGSIYHAMGNLSLARERFSESLRIRASIVGETHEATIAVRERLEAVIQDQEKIN